MNSLGDTPVPVRLAATVMIVRQAEPLDGMAIEILLLQRNAKGGFIPGATLYPGGAIDRNDHLVPLVDEDGPVPMKVTSEPSERYAVAAVARETYEEAGILLAVDSAGRFGSFDGDRERGFTETLRAGDLAVPAHRFVPWGRWVTPVGAPRRYDTLFFLIEAPPDVTVSVDGTEIVAAEWWRPAQALAAERAGELYFVTPTRKTLERLSACRTVAEALASGLSRT